MIGHCIRRTILSEDCLSAYLYITKGILFYDVPNHLYNHYNIVIHFTISILRRVELFFAEIVSFIIMLKLKLLKYYDILLLTITIESIKDLP